jgi:tetratricopeptide (TPR) repeat protein
LRFVVLLTLIAALGVSKYKLQRDSAENQRELLAPPASLVHFTFGYRETVADVFWLRAIQDFDYCEKKIRTSECRGKGWLFQTLDLITELSPLFRMAYSAGGMALTILVSDIAGASKFFDKAVGRFPKDWTLLYKAAYHALFEEKDKAKAAGLMERAARNGSPDWVFSLAARLYSEAGRIEVAERLLSQLQTDKTVDDMLAQRMRDKIELEKKAQ